MLIASQEYTISITRKCLSLLVMVLFICGSSASAQGIYEIATTTSRLTGDSTSYPSASGILDRKRGYAFPTIRRQNAQTIAGATFFFASIGYKYLVMAPRLNRIVESGTITSDDIEEARLLTILAVPVDMLRMCGASMACAGASRMRGTYSELVDPGIGEVYVWIPNIIGWVGRGMGVLFGFTRNRGLHKVAPYFTLAGEVAWTTSTIMSLVYSSKLRSHARHRLTFAPGYSPEYGADCVMEWSF